MPYAKGKSKTPKNALKNELLFALKKLYQDEMTHMLKSVNNTYFLFISINYFKDKSPWLKIDIIYLILLQNHPAYSWLNEQISYLETKNLTESYFFMSNIATALSYKLIKLAPHLFIPHHSSTEPLKNFINKCHQHIVILAKPEDSLNDVIERVLNEEKNLYHTTHLRSTSR